MAEAQELLEEHEQSLLPNTRLPFGTAKVMQGFIGSCNAPPSTPTPAQSCLYGVVSALWVVARAQQASGHDRAHIALLQHADFLLGNQVKYTYDFMESSGWPLSSLDIFANLQQPSEFRLPDELRDYITPKNPGGRALFQPGTTALVVWELGVHASLSAKNIYH